MTTTYANFDLLIDRGPAGYRARVLRSPVGEASVDFSLPFTPEELADFARRTARGTRQLSAAAHEVDDLDFAGFGGRLYQAVFFGPVGQSLRRSLDAAERRGTGLRIRLRLDAGVLDLAELPWEVLFAPDLGRFLALSDLTPLVRYVELDRPVQLLRSRLPLSLLAVVSKPGEVTPLDVEREWQNLQAALDPLIQRGVIVLERLEAATLPALQARLRREPVDLLHFVGHGFFDAGSNAGGLVFENDGGGPEIASAETLGMLLHDHQTLRLVFLNACQSAQGGRIDRFAGVAQRLVQQGVPAVLAMQFAVSDAAAIDLSQAFYQALADGLPADTALSQARKAIAARGSAWEWATPVLFSRSDDNRLFDLVEAAQDPLFGLPALPVFDLPDKPFHYLDWYRREDAEIFFGRGREIRDLYDRGTSPDGDPIILLYGQSGVGKSSLLAAGLLPRLQGSHIIRYVRRDQGRGLPGTLAAALGATPDEDLTAAWHTLEAQSGKPLLIVIDQIEEVFTRPNSDQPEELADFLDALAHLFADAASRPQGRLILGFRKEWLAEINKRLEERDLTRRRSEMFLERMGRDGISEVVAGPQSTPRLRARYGLTVTDAVPQLIADDLLADRGSPVAPMLAILLADMWDAAKARKYNRPVFDEDLYHEFRSRGLSLGDFLTRQMQALHGKQPEVVNSGLALDLLAYHTTPLGTAEQRTLADLEQTYHHRMEVLPALVQECRDLYLLVDPSQSQPGQPPASRLTHDTLAPHVRKRFDESDAPGQRARRILESRAVELKEDHERTLLYDLDLAIVESGSPGMRSWSAAESDLVVASRQAQARRVEEALRLQQTIDTARQREVEQAQKLAQSEAARPRQKTRIIRVLSLVLAVVALLGGLRLYRGVLIRSSDWRAIAGDNFPRDSFATSIDYARIDENPPEFVYCVGTWTVGVGCSRNGSTWNFYQQGFGTGRSVAGGIGAFSGNVVGIEALAIDQTNPEVLHVFASDEYFYRSLDAGVTWTPAQVALSFGMQVIRLKARDGLVVAITHFQERLEQGKQTSCLYFSVDVGQTWKKVAPASDGPLGECHDVAIDPLDNTIILATSNGLYSGVLQNNQWAWRRIGTLENTRLVEPVAGDDTHRWAVVTYDENTDTSALWEVAGSDQRSREKWKGEPRRLTLDPEFDDHDRGATIAYVLLRNGEVVDVRNGGESRMLPGLKSPLIGGPEDLVAVPRQGGFDQWLLMAHGLGLLRYNDS